MKFLKRFIPMIIDGTKTQTRRLSDKGYEVGKVYDVCDMTGLKTGTRILITRIRIEHLLNITEEDAIAEGVSLESAMEYADDGSPDYVAAFIDLWECIYGIPTGNPIVYVYEFEVAP